MFWVLRTKDTTVRKMGNIATCNLLEKAHRQNAIRQDDVVLVGTGKETASFPGTVRIVLYVSLSHTYTEDSCLKRYFLI